MMADWQKIDSENKLQILDEVNKYLTPVPFNPDSSAIRVKGLPFYSQYQLLELTDLSTVPAARKYAIYKPGDVSIIDWTNQPIYSINEKEPIKLTDKNVADYVKFFFEYVRGRHGRFLVVETIDDIHWQIEPPAQGRKVMQEMLDPVTVTGQEPNGVFKLEAFMVFKDSLFKTKIQVDAGGLVSMSDEELKIEGMPVLQDTAA